jgi:hypothetical protein
MTGFCETTYGNYFIRKCIIEYSVAGNRLRTFSTAQSTCERRSRTGFHRYYVSYEVFKTLIKLRTMYGKHYSISSLYVLPSFFLSFFLSCFLFRRSLPNKKSLVCANNVRSFCCSSVRLYICDLIWVTTSFAGFSWNSVNSSLERVVEQVQRSCELRVMGQSDMTGGASDSFTRVRASTRT